MRIYNSGDWVSIQLDNGLTKAFCKKNIEYVEDEQGNVDGVFSGVNADLKQQVDDFAGEGFFDTNIKDKL